MRPRGVWLHPDAGPRTVPRGRWRVSSGRALAEWAAEGGEEVAGASLAPGDEVEGQPPHVRASAVGGPCRLERAPVPEGSEERAARRAGIATAIAGRPQGRAGASSPTPLDEALAKRARTLAEARLQSQRELGELQEMRRSMDRDKAHLRWIESRIGVQAGAVSLGLGPHGVSADFAVAETDRLGRVWLVFGDSAGHGPGPSHFGLLASTLIRRNIDAVACESSLAGSQPPSPPWRHGAEALRRTAGALARSDGQYATAAVAMLSQTRRGGLAATWSLAGHPHPWICLPEGGTAPVRMLWGAGSSRAPNGTALGLSAKGRGHYPVFRATMPPGAALALLSDGVGDWLGRERILRIMARNLDRRAEVMCRELLQETRRRGPEREGDDRTALVARNVRQTP